MISSHKQGTLFTFRTDELAEPLLKSLELPVESTVVVIKLRTLHGIAAGNSYSGLSDPFVEFKLIPKDNLAGDQLQRSSNKTSTLNPRWEPAERFQLIASKKESQKVIMSVYHFNPNGKDASPLGDAFLFLKDVTDVPSVKKIKLIEPSTGKAKGEVSDTVLHCVCVCW